MAITQWKQLNEKTVADGPRADRRPTRRPAPLLEVQAAGTTRTSGPGQSQKPEASLPQLKHPFSTQASLGFHPPGQLPLPSPGLFTLEAVPPAVRGLSGAPGGKEPHGQLVCLKRPLALWLLVLTLRKHDPGVQAKPDCAWRGCGQGTHGRSRTHSAPVSPPSS